jgi:hypothetical protein
MHLEMDPLKVAAGFVAVIYSYRRVLGMLKKIFFVSVLFCQNNLYRHVTF